MRRAIEWKDETDEGEKRIVRVTYFSGMIKWQFQYGRAAWQYDIEPSVPDWEHLVEEIEQRYNRRRVPLKDLELAQGFLAKARRKQAAIDAAMAPKPPAE